MKSRDKQKQSDLIRAYKEDNLKLKDWSFKLTGYEGRKVSVPEVLRRTLKTIELHHPMVKDILVRDALDKKKKRYI